MQRNIMIGVCGGVSAYKVVDCVRQLTQQGHQVKVVLTEHAKAFVGEMTFQALSKERVHTELFSAEAEAAMGHIELAKWADLIIVAPATANMIAKMAAGLANDLLSTLLLATDAKVAIAPAMNQAMWHHPATTANIQTLVSRGVDIWGPASGEQACGDVGIGRLIEPSEILERVNAHFAPKLWTGSRWVITAGGTQEAIDPVRFIANRSSGKMGFAMAQAASEQGAKVVLIHGPSHLPIPQEVQAVAVTSAAQMHEQALLHSTQCDVFVGAAAVADYTVAAPSNQKMSKRDTTITLDLVRTPDVIRAVASLGQAPFCVGFAAQTHDVKSYAKAKLEAKGLDMIVANDVSQADIGFESNDNECCVLWSDGEAFLPKASKQKLAYELLNLIRKRYEHSTDSIQSSQPKTHA